MLDAYLRDFAGFASIGNTGDVTLANAPDATAPSNEATEGCIDGVGTIPAITFTVDSAVYLPGGESATTKLAGNGRTFAAVALKRIMGTNAERPAIDGFFEAGWRRRDVFGFLWSYEDTRVAAQLVR